MAFFTDKFLNDRREELLRSVDRFQYQLNGGAWQTGTVNSKEIIGTNVVVFVNVRHDHGRKGVRHQRRTGRTAEYQPETHQPECGAAALYIPAD